MTPKEKEEEIKEARLWGHYVRDYILDRPFYKDMPITPLVNFDLGFQ